MPPPFVSGTFSLRHGGLGFTEATYNAANQSASLHCWVARNREDRATIENHPFDFRYCCFYDSKFKIFT